jgi:hypothetical protein
VVDGRAATRVTDWIHFAFREGGRSRRKERRSDGVTRLIEHGMITLTL